MSEIEYIACDSYEEAANQSLTRAESADLGSTHERFYLGLATANGVMAVLEELQAIRKHLDSPVPIAITKELQAIRKHLDDQADVRRIIAKSYEGSEPNDVAERLDAPDDARLWEMTLVEVQQRVRALAQSANAAAGDDASWDVWHQDEDILMVDVLRQTAAGHPHAASMARAVLVTREWAVSRWYA